MNPEDEELSLVEGCLFFSCPPGRGFQASCGLPFPSCLCIWTSINCVLCRSARCVFVQLWLFLNKQDAPPGPALFVWNTHCFFCHALGPHRHQKLVLDLDHVGRGCKFCAFLSSPAEARFVGTLKPTPDRMRRMFHW
ncbi:hypothetical protein CHARACLAT_015456 [Characodon lateralis]|uniref:Uncharacterized protein n=1 Tax=Characodon lateralis TaxID=208331 RepID=A0ABU7EU50_9TELE|nr:hypothetical protein [Characodon lateralis]